MEETASLQEYETGRLIKGFVPKSTVEYGNRRATIGNVRITDLMARPRNMLITGLQYRYGYDVDFLDDTSDVSFGMLIKTVQGFELGGATNEKTTRRTFRAGTGIRVEFDFNCCLLPGTYFCNAGVMGSIDGREREYLHRLLDAFMFGVEPTAGSIEAGIVSLGVSMSIGSN